MTPDANASGGADRDTPSPIAQVAADLEAEADALQRELAEIGLLLTQARTESDRHEQRRTQLEERVTQLEESATGASPDLRAARQQLHDQTRRAALMASQIQVLEGKQRAAQRFADRLQQAVSQLSEAQIQPSAGVADDSASSRSVMVAQDQMRREIARQMHDGPAQSMANIALQAQVVERLIRRDPEQAERELAELNTLVQSTLEATKRFIFEVRPMVLDDLGLVATLRRSARERAQRSGVPIRFETIGPDARLEPEVESSVFRIVDDALAAFIEGRPEEVTVRLNWSVDALETTVQTRLPGVTGGPPGVETPEAGKSGPAEDLPPALAAMLSDQRERREAGAAAARQARGLPATLWDAMRRRAEQVGMSATLDEEGQLLQITASVPVR